MNFSKGWKLLIPLIAFCGFAFAQKPGMEVSGFRVPEYDDQGVMTSQLFGDHAEMLSGGQVKINGVRMEVYRDGETFLTVRSPYCFYEQKTREAHSDAPVEAEMDRVSLQGKGFDLQSSERKVEILEDSRVVIQDVMQQTGLETHAAAGVMTNETVITSTKLFLDYTNRTAYFVENVHVQDPQLALDSDSLEVRFGENNEIDWIEALGEVRIFHEGREAHAGKAVYDITTDEFLLEDNPRIVDGKNMLFGDQIRFSRANEKMVCEPSARLVIYPDEKTKTSLFEK